MNGRTEGLVVSQNTGRDRLDSAGLALDGTVGTAINCERSDGRAHQQQKTGGNEKGDLRIDFNIRSDSRLNEQPSQGQAKLGELSRVE